MTKDEEEMRELVRAKSEGDLRSASQKKENRLLQETMVTWVVLWYKHVVIPIQTAVYQHAFFNGISLRYFF